MASSLLGQIRPGEKAAVGSWLAAMRPVERHLAHRPLAILPHGKSWPLVLSRSMVTGRPAQQSRPEASRRMYALQAIQASVGSQRDIWLPYLLVLVLVLVS